MSTKTHSTIVERTPFNSQPIVASRNYGMTPEQRDVAEDVKRWMAKGNKPTIIPSKDFDSNDRRVRVPSRFMFD